MALLRRQSFCVRVRGVREVQERGDKPQMRRPSETSLSGIVLHEAVVVRGKGATTPLDEALPDKALPESVLSETALRGEALPDKTLPEPILSEFCPSLRGEDLA